MVNPVSALWFNGPAFPLLSFYWVPHCPFYKYWHLTLYMLIFRMTAKCYRSYQGTLKFYKRIWGWGKWQWCCKRIENKYRKKVEKTWRYCMTEFNIAIMGTRIFREISREKWRQRNKIMKNLTRTGQGQKNIRYMM